MKSSPSPPRVVVVGAGYAGVRAARDLGVAARRGTALEVVLINDTARHLDRSLLYEVASAYLPRESAQSTERVTAGAAVELAQLFAGLPVTVRIGRVTGIDLAHRLLTVGERESVSYDYLVLALGACLQTAGVTGVANHAFSVTGLSDTLTLRHHVVRQFHLARQSSAPLSTARLTFVVVGGGAAGVEIATELAGQVRNLCRKHGIDPSVPRLILLEAGSTILRRLPVAAQQYAHTRLRQLGITLRVNQAVTAVTADHLVLASGEKIPTQTVVWAGGLKPHPLLLAAGVPVNGWGVAVERTLQVQGEAHVFAAGDTAIVTDSVPPLPASVPVAYTQGALVAHNVLQLLRGRPLAPYRYHTIGELIALGGKDAVAVIGQRTVWHGWPAWVLKKLLTLRYWLGLLSWRGAWRFWRHSVVLQSLND